jgi:type VI secretion protein IcmF
MIRRFFRGLWNALRTPWVLALFVCLIFVAIVWLAGPYIAIADSKFLESVISRLITTVGLIFLWGLFVAVFYSRRKKKELSNPEKAAQVEVQVINRNKFREQVDYIKDKLKAALRIITNSNFYGSTSRSRYALPWYLVIGTKSSGKTSFLLNSGLQFPLNEQADRHLYRLNPTEQIETFFANQAIFIDTPGGYTDAQAGAEQNKLWLTLLRRILRIRPAKPVNGIIVCVSIRDLMDTDAASRTHIARVLRERLSEVLKRLHSYAPVYLVFTKCDAVPGFAQFFAHLNRPEREQIFGCPLENTGLETANIRAEIKEVMQNLNSQIISKIHQERDIVSRGDMFRFPQELSALGERIEDFIYEAFGPSRYHKPVMFRGFFFSSALSVQDVLAGSAREGELSFQTGFQPSLGDYAKGFFILRLVQDMIIPEAKLAGADKERIWGLRLRRHGLQVAASVLFLLSVFFMGISFINNYSRIDDINVQFKSFVDTQKQTASPPNSKSVLPELQELQHITTVYDPNNDPMLAYKLGLYQGTSFYKAAHDAYHGVLNSRLMPLLRKETANKIDQSLTNVSELKQALRSYLMLCQPQHLKAEALKPWLHRQWSTLYHGDASSQQSLDQHMDYLIANGIQPVEPDPALLERARQALLKIPLAELAYQQMKEEAVESGKPPFSFRNSLGESMSPFDGDTYSIPYLYTRNGYDEYCLKRCPVIITNLTTDSWVFGSSPITLSSLDIDKVYKDVRTMYFKDYTLYWAEAVQKLSVRQPQNLADAAKISNQLTSGISPIVLILREVKENTSLVAAVAADDPLQDALLDQAQKAAGRKASGLAGAQVGRVVAQQARSATEEAMQRALEEAQKEAKAVGLYFKPLVGLLDDNGNPGQALMAAHDAASNTSSYFEKMLGDHNQRVLSALLEIADGKDSILYTAETAAQKLPTPVKTWYEVVPSEGFKLMLSIAANNINQTYRDRVLNVYNRELSSYYPLNSRADTDVNLENFSSFFRSGGVLDNFYDANLKPFMNPNGTLKSIMGRTLPLSTTALAQLHRANRVQSAFFSSGRDIGINFMIEPYALDATLKQVDLGSDGKVVSYWHGPVKGESYTWPLANGISSKASLSFTDLNGVGVRKDASGEWALFRILQSGTIKRQDGNVCMVELQQNGKWAQFLIQFRNRLNPFDPSVCSFTLPQSLR